MSAAISYDTMSTIEPPTSKFDSVASIISYLRESPQSEVVSSSTTSSTQGSATLKSTIKQKKEKDWLNVPNATAMNSNEFIQVRHSGRVKYGPITVNPRKQPSKTLFTGRRSKYEILSSDEEEKRRLRRERNRIAATKCREKRESILINFEKEYKKELACYSSHLKMVQQLEEQKQHLESVLSNHMTKCQLPQMNSAYLPPITTPTPPQQQQQQQQQLSMVFGDPSFLSSIIETPAPPLPPHEIQITRNDDEKSNSFCQSTSLLTNSAYDNDQSNYLLNFEQQTPQQTFLMNSSSLERLITGLHSPTDNNNNNNNYSTLYNSAYGSSSCAQQHSNSSEDDSLPPTHNNSFVC